MIEFIVKEKQSPTTAVGTLEAEERRSTGARNAERARDSAWPHCGSDEHEGRCCDPRARYRRSRRKAERALRLSRNREEDGAGAARRIRASSAYDAVGDASELAGLLTEQLQAVSHDKHLHIDFVPTVAPEGDPEPSAEDKAKFREQLERMNCGFEKAERLDGGIGYVKFDMFGDVEICGPKATAALGSLGDVDALIFDLRQTAVVSPRWSRSCRRICSRSART